MANPEAGGQRGRPRLGPGEAVGGMGRRDARGGRKG